MMALDMGHKIVGSDRLISPMSEELEKRKVEIGYTQDGIFLEDQHNKEAIDMFVYTAALPDDHAELMYAKDNHIKAVKRDDLINQLLVEKGLKTLAVTGTHGKTTVTAMLVWAFQELDIPITHSVGTTMSFAPSGRYQQGSEFFVYEADEYDKNFLKFKPQAAIITSIDYDHPDTYPTKDDYYAAFAQFIYQTKMTTIWDEDVYSFDAYADRLQVLDVQSYQHNVIPNMLGIKLPGVHNRMNATLVAEFMLKQVRGTEKEKIVEILNRFPGTSRRFEKLVDNLYTDYAHHPTEIKATLQLAGEQRGKVIAVYQPHQNVRQHYLLQLGGYNDAFDTADMVYWLPTYLSREDDKLDIYTPQQLIESMDKDLNIKIMEMNDELKAAIDDHIAKGHTVVAMSAGDLDGWLRDRYIPREPDVQ